MNPTRRLSFLALHLIAIGLLMLPTVASAHPDGTAETPGAAASVLTRVRAGALELPALPPRATATVPSQPETVSRDVDLDLARAVPSDVGRRLASGGLRTTSAVRSRPLTACAGFWFTALGVVWHQRGPEAVHGSISWFAEAGSVLGRSAFSPDADAPGQGAPDFRSGLVSSDLVWSGGGRCARIVVQFPAGITISGLRIAFANTSGSAAGPGTGPPDVTPAPDLGNAPPSIGVQAGGGPRMPAMISRASWGADPRAFNTGSPGCSAPYYAPEVKVAYVHHTSGSNSYSRSRADDVVRGIYWFHTQERGYCDIAYSFLVDRYGRVFVGRFGGADLPVIPGSQAGFNPYTFSVSLMGNFQIASPPKAAIASLERVLAWRLDVAHVPATGKTTLVSQGYDTDRYPPGVRVTMHTIEGHRRTSQTDCPGDHIEVLLPQIRRTVAAMGGPKILRPRQSAQRVTPGNGTVRFTATATVPLRWTVTIRGRGGATIRTLAPPGRTTGLSATWNGYDGAGDPAPAGKYFAVIAGKTTSGSAPRPATLPIDVPGPPPSPLPAPNGTASVPSGFPVLRAVAATGRSDVWAVGSVAGVGAVRPLVRHLGQSGWRGVIAPNPGSHGSALQAVDALAPEDAWAAGFSCLGADCGPNGGFGSRALLEHWNGSRWRAVRSPSPGTALNELRAVDVVAADDVWAAGVWSDRGRYLRHGLVLHWNGSAWRQVPIPFINGDVHLDGISAAGSDDAWAVGEVCPGPCSGLAHSSAVTMHWDGTRFTRVAPARVGADRSGLDGILSLSADEAWAVGGRAANRVAPTHPLAERWDGSKWRLEDTPPVGTSSQWFGIARVPGAGLVSAGGFSTRSAERPLVERRASSGTWNRATVPGPNTRLAFLSSLAPISRTNIWAVGPSTGGPLVVHWNGSGWNLVNTG
jgi:hypothetical protein